MCMCMWMWLGIVGWFYTWSLYKSEEDREKSKRECKEGCLDTDSGNEEKGDSSGQSKVILHDPLRASCH